MRCRTTHEKREGHEGTQKMGQSGGITIVMNLCRYCGLELLPVDSVKTVSYWNEQTYYCHRVCKVAGERQEAIDCQTIDADCNDCKHFKRGRLTRPATDTAPGSGSFTGQCLKFNKPTIATVKLSTGHECFEHRRLQPELITPPQD